MKNKSKKIKTKTKTKKLYKMYLLISSTKNYSVDIIARRYNAALIILKDLLITHLLLDFNLDEKKTGEDLLLALAPDIPLNVQIVSLNPAGRLKLKHILINNGYKEQGRWFVKS